MKEQGKGAELAFIQQILTGIQHYVPGTVLAMGADVKELTLPLGVW